MVPLWMVYSCEERVVCALSFVFFVARDVCAARIFSLQWAVIKDRLDC